MQDVSTTMVVTFPGMWECASAEIYSDGVYDARRAAGGGELRQIQNRGDPSL